DGLENAVPDVPVAWSASDTGGAASTITPASTTTDASGNVVALVASPSAGTTTVGASLDPVTTDCEAPAGGSDAWDVGKPAGVCSAQSSITWGGPPQQGASSISLTPDTQTNPEYDPATVTATVTDKQ